jgi:hypothetical protein
MIQLSDEAEKKYEFFRGKITIVLSDGDEDEWNFYLVRKTNGKIEDEVEVDRAQFEERFGINDYESGTEEYKKVYAEMLKAMSILEETVLANVRKNTVQWTPQNLQA